MSSLHSTNPNNCKVPWGAGVAVYILTLMTNTSVWAHDLVPIVVTGNYDNSVGSSDAASQGVITSQILENRALLRPGEMLEYVPGLVVTQHSGDGKANQYFLRGFNLDHGTDFATSINGMPINMPTNAHGHGYSDLNFLIPELVQRVDYRKGPYFVQDGDFSSAGAADFHYKTQLEQDFAQFTLGQRGYGRFVGAASHELNNGMRYVAAVEQMQNNGPWTVAENLKRSNGVFMLSDGSRANGWTASLMSYAAHWNATDQVPLSMIETGQLGRFDSLDATDGGKTRRTSASLDWRRTQGAVFDRVMAYAIAYDLSLFSNFTYYANDNDRGDQFMQKEQRKVYGLKTTRQWEMGDDVRWRNTLGFQTRSDGVDVQLANTQARQVNQSIRHDQVRQNLSGVFGETQAQWQPWLRTQVGLRYDQYNTHVDSLLTPDNSGVATASRWSPKFTLVLGPWAKTEYFFNAGRGFHSNDARGTTAKVDPVSNEAVSRVPGLVGSRGYELGMKTEAMSGVQTSLVLWRLDFDSELVYVGDAGGTEAGRASTRTGVEWNNRWLPSSRWILDADLAWTRPRYSNDDGSGVHIPNAVEKVAMLAVTIKDVAYWNLSAQLRYIGAAALVEDNSVKSSPSTTVNLKARRKWDKHHEVDVDVLNLFNRQYNDIAYLGSDLKPYKSNLLVLNGNQVQVHPGEPRTLRMTYAYRF